MFLKTFLENQLKLREVLVVRSVLRIRITLMQIRISHFHFDADPDPNFSPDLVPAHHQIEGNLRPPAFRPSTAPFFSLDSS
jgi:hypothetical protein